MSSGTVARLCACGRETPPRHCPACGSTNIYAKDANARILKVQDEQVLLRGFRCRKCALDFNEGTQCEAPLNASMRQRRERDKQAERAQLIMRLPTDQRKAELSKLFNKLGSKATGADVPKEETKEWTETSPILNDVPKPSDKG